MTLLNLIKNSLRSEMEGSVFIFVFTSVLSPFGIASSLLFAEETFGFIVGVLKKYNDSLYIF